MPYHNKIKIVYIVIYILHIHCTCILLYILFYYGNVHCTLYIYMKMYKYKHIILHYQAITYKAPAH